MWNLLPVLRYICKKLNVEHFAKTLGTRLKHNIVEPISPKRVFGSIAFPFRDPQGKRFQMINCVFAWKANPRKLSKKCFMHFRINYYIQPQLCWMIITQQGFFQASAFHKWLLAWMRGAYTAIGQIGSIIHELEQLHDDVFVESAGLSMGMSFLWESHGKRPMGWDGTAHICISHETHK